MKYIKDFKSVLNENEQNFGKVSDYIGLIDQIPNKPQNYIRLIHSTRSENVNSILLNGIQASNKPDDLQSYFVDVSNLSNFVLYDHKGAKCFFLIDLKIEEFKKLSYLHYYLKDRYMPKERIIGYFNIENPEKAIFIKNDNYNQNSKIDIIKFKSINSKSFFSDKSGVEINTDSGVEINNSDWE